MAVQAFESKMHWPHNVFMKKYKPLVYLILLSLVTACFDSGNDSVKNALKESFETPPAPSGNVVNGTCYVDQYATPNESIVRKLDIAIVIDTSGSIVDERANIADGFDYLIGQLPEEVDYRIAVILGHGDKTGKSGILYKKGSEPRVLSSDNLTVDEVKAHLKTKLQNPSVDNETDGGELGMYSFLKATQGTYLEANRDEDFFREDAALTVIFVADENDICSKFPEGVTAVPDPDGGETKSFKKYCIDEGGNYLITAEDVVTRIHELQGSRPSVVGGVLYSNSETIPLVGENEIGYGYIDVINLAAGINVDLANGDYSDGLTKIGRLATVSMMPANDFNLKSSKVDPSTISVLVNNVEAAFEYDSELNQVHLVNERDPFSVAKVQYCDKEELPLEVKQLVAGGFHTCALLISGDVKCWGRNNFGQLGLGHTNNIGDDELVSSIAPINLGAKAIELSAGFQHTCAILENGSVKCWGENLRGQLGQGHSDSLGDDEVPSDIPAIPLAALAKKIYSGTRYNCALLENKKVQCWGENNFGQLGLGHTNNIGDDESLSGLGYLQLGGNVVKMDISTISFHSCALLESGTLKCWGKNSEGQLGLGHTNNIGDDELPDNNAIVSFGPQILQLATGNTHTCALAGGQQIYCWGSNNKGQIGTGNAADTIGDNEVAGSTEPVLTGASGHSGVATGNFHTCAVGTNNNVYCWGDGTNGVTGHGNTNNIGDNEAVSGNAYVNLGEAPISQVASGIQHTCALTKDFGKVICWGSSAQGQLGYGNTNTIGDNESPGAFVPVLAAE